MTEIEHFPFYVTYADIDLYLDEMLDITNENKDIIHRIDSNADVFLDNKLKLNADELLLKLRQFLVDNGYSSEVEKVDEVFITENRKRKKKNFYIPMHERWKKD